MKSVNDIIESGGLLAVLIAAVTGFLGWRIGSAKDSVRLEHAITALAEEKRAREHDVDNLHNKIAAISRQDREEMQELTRLLSRQAELTAAQSSTLSAVADQIGQINRRLEHLDGGKR